MSHLRALCNARPASTWAIRCAAAGTRPGVLFVLRLAFAGSAGPLISSLNVAPAGESQANYRRCAKWKEARVALAKRAPVESRQRSCATG